MTRTAGAERRHLRDVARSAIAADPALAHLDPGQVDGIFDPVAATAPARRLASQRFEQLRADLAAFDDRKS
jgi:3-carboxy-cis,cis-muconate cycloisomerase